MHEIYYHIKTLLFNGLKHKIEYFIHFRIFLQIDYKHDVTQSDVTNYNWIRISSSLVLVGIRLMTENVGRSSIKRPYKKESFVYFHIWQVVFQFPYLIVCYKFIPPISPLSKPADPITTTTKLKTSNSVTISGRCLLKFSAKDMLTFLIYSLDSFH